jgi:hypothetical protein
MDCRQGGCGYLFPKLVNFTFINMTQEVQVSMHIIQYPYKQYHCCIKNQNIVTQPPWKNSYNALQDKSVMLKKSTLSLGFVLERHMLDPCQRLDGVVPGTTEWNEVRLVIPTWCLFLAAFAWLCPCDGTKGPNKADAATITC